MSAFEVGGITITVIGITGPTGAGKTTVLKEIEALGGAVIDCDAVYHEMLESDRALQESLERAFGPLRDGQGAIDRKKLGALVFGDPAKLEKLYEHPTLLRTPIVRNGKQATVGYCPEVWAEWK